MSEHVPEIEEYIKRLNWYLQEHYPANKKITAEEWNALFLALMNQGNAQEDTLAKICNEILPGHVTAINDLLDSTAQHDSRIAALESDIDEIHLNIADLNADVEAMQSDISDLDEAQTLLSGRVDSLETGLSGKLDKTTTPKAIYGTNNSGEQSLLGYTDSATAWSIAQRNGDGNLKVGLTPTDNAHAASKKYVDENGGKIDTIKVEGVTKTITNKTVNILKSDLDIDDIEALLPSTATSTNKLVDNATMNSAISPLATRVELNEGLSQKQDNLPTAVNDRYLHTNADTGELEWSQIIIPEVDLSWGNITGDIEDQEDLASELQNIREVAEGKNASYVIDDEDDIIGTKDSDNNYTNVTAITGVTISDLKIGDNIFIKNTEVPDYWVSQLNQTEGVTTSVSLNKLSTEKVDLNNYYTKTEIDSTSNSLVHKTGNESVAGTKTFTDTIKLSSSYDSGIFGDQYGNLKFKRNGNILFSVANYIGAGTNNSTDLGSASVKWRDLYLSRDLYMSGALKNGTDSITIAQIVAKQDALPTTVNDKYLHVNATTGALEWSGVQSSLPDAPTDPAQHVLVSNDGEVEWYKDNTIKTSPQTLTENEKAQVRANIGAGSSTINVIDALDSTAIGDALSANMGRVLNETKVGLTNNESITGVKSFEANPKAKRGTITARIPEEYQEVEYLTMNSTVNTSYVNFGVQWKDATKITSKVKVYANNTSTMIFGIGSQAGPYIALSRCNSLTNPSPSSFTGYTDLDWHDFEITFSASSTSNICTSKYDGTWAKKISYGETIIYGANDEILVHAIPCIKRVNDEAGFYDTINEVFLPNVGTQTILYNNPLDTVWHPNILAETDIWEKAFNPSNTPLSAIKIGNRNYRLVQQGTTDNSYGDGKECGIAIGYNSYSARAHGMAIGSNAKAGNANTTCAIGNGASASGPRATALGYGANCVGDYSAAIGPSAYNIIQQSVTSDTPSRGTYIHMLNPSYLFFRYENQASGKVHISDYTNGKSLQALLDEKQNNLPTVTNDRYLHTNADTGELEWSEVSSGETYTAGNGIGITNNVISIDTNVVATLDDIPDISNLATKTELSTGLATKENTISDLSTIRSGAALGATALQPGNVINNLTSTDINKPLSANMGKVLKDDLDNVRNVAEGKTATYVINDLTDITGTKGSDDNYTNVTAITGVTIANLKLGDIILVKNTEVRDYWVSLLTKTGDVVTSVSLNKLEVSKVDLTDYYTKTETNTLLNAKANDNAVVHLNVDETITSDKTIAENQKLYFADPRLFITSDGEYSNYLVLGYNQDVAFQSPSGGRKFLSSFIERSNYGYGPTIRIYPYSGSTDTSSRVLHLQSSESYESVIEFQGSVSPGILGTLGVKNVGYSHNPYPIFQKLKSNGELISTQRIITEVDPRIKSASVANNTLTLTKQDDTTITFQGGQDISTLEARIAALEAKTANMSASGTTTRFSGQVNASSFNA